MTAYVLTCDEANYTPASPSSTGEVVGGTCAAPYYAPQEGVLPPLSISDGVTISMAILAVWAVGFGIKAIRRNLSH